MGLDSRLLRGRQQQYDCSSGSSATIRELDLGSWPLTSAGNQSELNVTFMLPPSSAKSGVVVMGSSSSSNVNDEGESTKRGAIGVDFGRTQEVLQKHENETAISIHVFVDNTMAEGYWQGESVAMSTLLTPTTDSSMAAVATTSSAYTVVSCNAGSSRGVDCRSDLGINRRRAESAVVQ